MARRLPEQLTQNERVHTESNVSTGRLARFDALGRLSVGFSTKATLQRGIRAFVGPEASSGDSGSL